MILRLLVYSYYQIVVYGCLAANEHVWSELQKIDQHEKMWGLAISKLEIIDQHEKMWSFAIVTVAVVGLAAVRNICLVARAADSASASASASASVSASASASALLCVQSAFRILRRSALAQD